MVWEQDGDDGNGRTMPDTLALGKETNKRVRYCFSILIQATVGWTVPTEVVFMSQLAK